MEVERGINAARLPKFHSREHREAVTLKTTLQALAEDIALGLAREIRSNRVVAEPTAPRIIHLFVDPNPRSRPG